MSEKDDIEKKMLDHCEPKDSENTCDNCDECDLPLKKYKVTLKIIDTLLVRYLYDHCLIEAFSDALDEAIYLEEEFGNNCRVISVIQESVP